MVVSRGHAAEQSPSHVTDSRVGRKHLAHRGGHHTTQGGNRSRAAHAHQEKGARG